MLVTAKAEFIVIYIFTLIPGFFVDLVAAILQISVAIWLERLICYWVLYKPSLLLNWNIVLHWFLTVPLILKSKQMTQVQCVESYYLVNTWNEKKKKHKKVWLIWFYCSLPAINGKSRQVFQARLRAIGFEHFYTICKTQLALVLSNQAQRIRHENLVSD